MATCECGFSPLPTDGRPCPACGGKSRPKIDIGAVLQRTERDLRNLRLLEAGLGVVLLLSAWPTLLYAIALRTSGRTVAIPLLLGGVALLVSSVVNLLLAAQLRRGAAGVARAHLALSSLGLGVGLLACGLCLVEIVWGRLIRDVFDWGSSGIPPVVGILLLPVLAIPARALVLLHRSDVKAYLGIGPLPDRESLRRSFEGAIDAREVAKNKAAAGAMGVFWMLVIGGILAIVGVAQLIYALCSHPERWLPMVH